MLSLHPRELDTRGPLVDEGWHQGLSPCPHLPAPLTPLNTIYVCPAGGAGH